MQTSKNYIFTSESVSEGHPDKVCDQISDAILDLFITADNRARVACETLATTNRVVLSGEVGISKNKEMVSPEKIELVVRNKVREIGYEQKGFHWKNLSIHNYLHEQSNDIAIGVDEKDDKDQGAGDQGMMFGYACNETDNFMPAPIDLSHKILKELANYRHENDSFFGPDSKSQVSVKYENDKPIGVSSIVVSTQHNEKAENQEIKSKVIEIVRNTLPQKWLPDDDGFLINPTGRFVIGGPDGDTGLTGRKIIVDTYGGAAPHGGGAFSGKDQTKVDRSAAYMARYLAKNIVASGLSEDCLIQLSYAIGISNPVSFYLKTNLESDVNIERLKKVILDNVDLTPSGIREHLKLDRPIYSQTATYGHFGRTPCLKTGTFTWEKTDLVDKIKKMY